jgi:hypothetical protein
LGWWAWFEEIFTYRAQYLSPAGTVDWYREQPFTNVITVDVWK